MSGPVLELRPGPFAGKFRERGDLLAALSLLPHFVCLAALGHAEPLLAPAAALLAGLLLKKRRPDPAALAAAGLAGVLVGPGAPWPSYAAAGLAASLAALTGGVFRHRLLPAAAAGLVAGRLAAWLGALPPASPGLPPAAFLLLLPTVPAALTPAGRRLARVMLPWALWLGAAALFRPSASHLARGLFPPAGGLFHLLGCWLVLSAHLGRELWPGGSGVPSLLVVILAGLFLLALPASAPWVLCGLTVLELLVYRRASRPDAWNGRRTGAADVPAAPSREPPPAPEAGSGLVAVRLCARPPGAVALTAEYAGPASCRLAAILDDGPLACPEACLGLGDCVRFCPRQALTPAASPGAPPGLNAARCRGCGLCLEACPKGLMVLRPRSAAYVVRCRGSARMRDMDALCPEGCLSCGLCRKACPAGAVGRPGRLSPPEVSDEACAEARPGCALACRKACPRGLPGPAMGLL
ncbi:MAG: 4Fe-4S dicluster domain-containing protein [Deltaproteobacteria bacterium]|jgi:ferredoxin|nr:4Fe-4S dicluster domain-containing protein [Deltaproteobacteria bacterium]